MISLLGNRLMSTLVSAILLANFAAAIDDCRDDFAALDFDLLSFDKYPSYFRSDSKLEVIVASEQTGEYVGTAAIEEYILVLTDSNMQESQEAFVDMKLIDIDDDSTTCTFELAKKLEPENATGAKTAGGETLITVVYDYSARYIPLIRILSVPPVNKQSESKQSEDEPSELIFILVGFTAPALVMLAVFLLVKRKPSHDQQRRTSIASKDARSNPLLQKRAKNIRIVILVTFLALLIANGLAGLIVWWAAKEFNWETMEQPDHRSDALSFTETVPQANLSDSDFGVYTGFVVWLTCIISAFGLEIFVWREFLQEWTPLHERAWRFAQFIFPLLALVSFGLAGQGNFLCLPFCVVGFWKFGFPEAFMLLYLGLHGKRSSQKRRLVDFLNGIGTVIHHGAASMIISMFVSGVCPATPLVRYATNVVLLLTMQHWAVLLKYVHEPSYAAVSLGIEFYFEWSVFCESIPCGEQM